MAENETPDPATCQHNYQELYYTYRCRKCGLEFPTACAPWLPDDIPEPDEDDFYLVGEGDPWYDG